MLQCKTSVAVALAVALGLALAGCGQKGPLVLANPVPAAAVPAASGASR